MIGESLEVHCHNEFNKLRPLFKNAYFEKDFRKAHRSVKGMIDHERERRQQAKEAADEKASTEKVENDS